MMAARFAATIAAAMAARSWMLLAVVCVVAGCATGRPGVPPPDTVDPGFFPITTGSWWEFESFLPGFPDKPLVDRFVVKPPDENGRYPVFIRTKTIHRFQIAVQIYRHIH